MRGHQSKSGSDYRAGQHRPLGSITENGSLEEGIKYAHNYLPENKRAFTHETLSTMIKDGFKGIMTQLEKVRDMMYGKCTCDAQESTAMCTAES